MVSYRLVVFGMGIISIGLLLIFFNLFVSDALSVSASVASSSEAETSRAIFTSILNGFAFVVLMLGGLFVVAGALADRARNA